MFAQLQDPGMGGGGGWISPPVYVAAYVILIQYAVGHIDVTDPTQGPFNKSCLLKCSTIIPIDSLRSATEHNTSAGW